MEISYGAEKKADKEDKVVEVAKKVKENKNPPMSEEMFYHSFVRG